jgi:hypothetical protein
MSLLKRNFFFFMANFLFSHCPLWIFYLLLSASPKLHLDIVWQIYLFLHMYGCYELVVCLFFGVKILR